MKKLERLKKEALESCKFRGHNMFKFSSRGDHTAVSKCKKCYMGVWVETRPLPNEIEIGGNAVALNCEKEK